MTPYEYSDFVESMIVTKQPDRLLENLTGLAAEVGEVHAKFQKYFRDEVYDNAAVLKELGDVLFYTTALANALGYNLEDVMLSNYIKLKDRKQRGVVKGNGDER